MTTITKDEVRNLTPEQQEAIGSVELQRIRVRQEMVERARCYGGKNVIAALFMGLAIALAMLSLAYPAALAFAVLAVIFSLAFIVGGLHRRLDALLYLIDNDKRHAPNAERSHDSQD